MANRSEKFEILIASDPDHEEVAAEIYVNGKFVALINQDEGYDQLLLELPGPGLNEQEIERNVDLDGFLEAIGAARKRLIGKP